MRNKAPDSFSRRHLPTLVSFVRDNIQDKVPTNTIAACRKIASIVCLLLASLGAAAEESVRGPDVTIIAEEQRTIFEYRQNGYIRIIKVVPKLGKPYYLVPRDLTAGDTDLMRADMLLPSWKLIEF